jgi:hypothetical protein
MHPINRRQFTAMLTALGIHSDHPVFASAESSAPELLQLSRNGWMPNNERLPVLLYHGSFQVAESNPASIFEWAFERNGWPRSGATAFTTSITITPPRTRFWDLHAGVRA